MNFVKNINWTALVANAIVIVSAVNVGISSSIDGLLDEQQARAQYQGNLLAYGQVIKQGIKLKNDPGDLKTIDLLIGSETCTGKDFNKFFYVNLASYEKNEFDNSCEQINHELSKRN